MASQIFYLIKLFADAQGKSLKEVGRQAGLGENSIYRWRKSLPKLDALVKVAKALHVNYKELLP